MNHLFKWNGEYLGFENNGYLFDKRSTYLGWIEKDGRVWATDGKFIGQLIDGRYILRNSMMMEPMRRMPRMTPMSPMSPMAPMPRMPKMPRIGWNDPFDS